LHIASKVKAIKFRLIQSVTVDLWNCNKISSYIFP